MPQALTDEQRQFAAENHNLIYKYLWDRRLEIDDYYDIAVFGYLRAVKRYLTEPWLHRYQFSTVAWHAMRQSIASLNYILSSNVWQQDHNGFTHQDPGFLDHVVNKKADVVRIYLPPDAN